MSGSGILCRGGLLVLALSLSAALGSGRPVEGSVAELVDNASLVVVARKVGRRSGEVCVGESCQTFRRGWWELSVVEVLKGDPAVSTIRFNRIGLGAMAGQDAMFFLVDRGDGLYDMAAPATLSVVRSDVWGNLITDDGVALRLSGTTLAAAKDVDRAMEASGRRYLPVEAEVPVEPTFDAAVAMAGSPPANVPETTRWDDLVRLVRSLAE